MKPFEYVYVNQDGTARELSEKEREYLSADFSGGDGGRPYVKAAYAALDGWGSRSGFMARDQVPASMAIQPVNPEYDARVAELTVDPQEDSRRLGDIITRYPDGSYTCTPNPNLSTQERAEKERRLYLKRQRQREQLASVRASS